SRTNPLGRRLSNTGDSNTSCSMPSNQASPQPDSNQVPTIRRFFVVSGGEPTTITTLSSGDVFADISARPGRLIVCVMKCHHEERFQLQTPPTHLGSPPVAPSGGFQRKTAQYSYPVLAWLVLSS